MTLTDAAKSFGLGALGSAIGGPFTKVPKYGAYPTAASREMVDEGNAVRQMRTAVTGNNAGRSALGTAISTAGGGCN
jgi:hypothetical protein